MTKLVSPVNGQVLAIHNKQQREFYNKDQVPQDYGDFLWYALERQKDTDYTYPERHLFVWETDKEESLVEVSESPDFDVARKIFVKGNETIINNFRINSTYFWRVNGCEPGTFMTEDAVPRFIEAEGVANIRDAGGWKTKYGCRIQQDMLFRGTEMDKHYAVTEKGLQVLKGDLKIRTVIDLRGDNEWTHVSPLGEDVQVKHVPISAYDGLIKEQKDKCKEIFDILAQESNYPIYYHCLGGADRTGTVAFLLGAALGMDEEDLLMDYEMTSMCIWGDRCRETKYCKALLGALAEYPGETVQQQCIDYLHDCGITEGQLNIIRSILLEKYPT